MLERIIGIIKLDIATYEEVEHDENATQQAAIIVVVVSLLAALGAMAAVGAAGNVLEQLQGMEGFGDVPGLDMAVANMTPTGAFFNTFINGILNWIIWSYATYFVGTRFFGGDATPQEMLRVMGFAQVPRVLAPIPCLGVIGSIWSIVCGFIAIRQGLDVDNTKTILTVLVTIIIAFVVSLAVGAILGLVGLAM